ncbi:MAG TPA: molybdate ABC transporter substrate-binding protein, partial [Paracoccaceae bacterium]|nr:molybdate ABC transporter substrate-binding protein [Paracoccaceae bacterium]
MTPALALAACSAEGPAPAGPIVLAPSSLQEALGEVSDSWSAQGHARPVLSFAGSPTIARQIVGGAPADILLLADEQWMDQLQGENLLAPGTRRALLGNRLVLIAPADQPREVVSPNLNDLPALLGADRMAMADPDSVPAGRYGKMALQALGLWDQLSTRIAP